jgi:uncharacterized membrane protein
VAHHHFVALLAKSDRGLLWLNSLFLSWLAFVPFPTARLGDYPNQRVAVVCYGAVMTLAGLSISWMRFYAFYIGKLIVAALDRTLLKRAMLKSAMNPLLHLIAVPHLTGGHRFRRFGRIFAHLVVFASRAN